MATNSSRRTSHPFQMSLRYSTVPRDHVIMKDQADPRVYNAFYDTVAVEPFIMMDQLDRERPEMDSVVNTRLYERRVTNSYIAAYFATTGVMAFYVFLESLGYSPNRVIGPGGAGVLAGTVMYIGARLFQDWY